MFSITKLGREDKLLLIRFMGHGRKAFSCYIILRKSWRIDVPVALLR
jgi:hypothetical protein